jgi:methylmalonyl-CoA mutase cobalamin-binding subunit
VTPDRHPAAAAAPACDPPLRFVTATSLYDGHDVAINLIRRLLQARVWKSFISAITAAPEIAAAPSRRTPTPWRSFLPGA